MLLGVIFIIIANLFAVWSPKIIQQAFDMMNEALNAKGQVENGESVHVTLPNLLENFFAYTGIHNPFEGSLSSESELFDSIASLTLLLALAYLLIAVFKGIFSFFTRQTIIIVSRKIEYDLKNKIYAHYQNSIKISTRITVRVT